LPGVASSLGVERVEPNTALRGGLAPMLLPTLAGRHEVPALDLVPRDLYVRLAPEDRAVIRVGVRGDQYIAHGSLLRSSDQHLIRYGKGAPTKDRHNRDPGNAHRMRARAEGWAVTEPATIGEADRPHDPAVASDQRQAAPAIEPEHLDTGIDQKPSGLGGGGFTRHGCPSLFRSTDTK
jgi:hypothetical protein